MDHVHEEHAPVTLIVEDDHRVMELVSKSLDRAGHQVLRACNAGEALGVVKEWVGRAIDLLVMDVRLPGGDGLRLAKRIKRQLPEVKVLFVSAYSRREVVGQCAGQACTFLAKPFTPSELLAEVQTLLRA